MCLNADHLQACRERKVGQVPGECAQARHRHRARLGQEVQAPCGAGGARLLHLRRDRLRWDTSCGTPQRNVVERELLVLQQPCVWSIMCLHDRLNGPFMRLPTCIMHVLLRPCVAPPMHGRCYRGLLPNRIHFLPCVPTALMQIIRTATTAQPPI